MRTEDILKLREDLVAGGARRHDKYDFLISASGGDYETRRLEAAWQTFQHFVGKQDIPFDRETFEFRLNLIPSIIRASRSFIATIPTVRCPPADPMDENARKSANKLERVLLGHWQDSYIGRRMNQMGYFNPSLGNTIGVIWPDEEEKRPKLQMRSPYGFYAVLKDLDGYELKCALFVSKYPARQVRAMFPALADKIPETLAYTPVTQYIGEDEIVTIVDDKWRVNEIQNDWGFVNCVIIPNESFGEGPWGESDIEWVIPLQAEHNYRSTLQNALLSLMQMQPVAIEDGDNVPEQVAMGALDSINVNAGGRVYRVNPPQVPIQVFQAQSELISQIDRVGQVPPVMRGEFAGNVLTGKGVSALQGPSQMQYNIKANEIYPALAMLNKMAMKMWAKRWGGQQHTVYYVDTGKNGDKNMVTERFDPLEFEWYENVVTVDTSTYFDMQAKFMMNLQAVQNRLKSRVTASGEMPGVDDPELEQELIKKEFADDIAMQQQATQQDQGNPQPNPGAQVSAARGLQHGTTGKLPPPEPIAGTEPPSSPGEPPAAGFLQDMILFFSDVPKLRGKVWLAGNIVSDPNYSPQSPNYNGIEVFLELPNDKATINTTMHVKYPEVFNHLVYHNGEPSPDEPSVLVFDPATEAPTEQLPSQEAGVPSGPPPEMAGVMGGGPV